MTPLISATEPGGLQVYLHRTIPEKGLLEFEYAPKGYLTKKGEPRYKEWRAYYWTPPGGKRTRLTAVSTVLGVITSMGGLPYWYEKGGIKGAHEAHRMGLLADDDSPERAVEVVRAEKLGGDAERDRAADRGLNIHALLESYMKTGKAPNPRDHPAPHRGFLSGMVAWLLRADPEPEVVEQIVCDPDEGYAGRIDLVAHTKPMGSRLLTTVDAKTQENGGIYLQAHAQLALYNRGYRYCGGLEPERSLVVVFAANGEFREMELALTEEAALAALRWYEFAKPVESLCEGHNRFEKKARQAVAV